MAMNVFGIIVTDDIVRTYPEYADKTVITRTDRAAVAMLKKNDNNKDANALKYVDDLKNAYGNGVSALCMVYNATGDTIRFVTDHDWSGHLWSSPYPDPIGNGQWGAFLHVHTSGAAVGAEAAVVYRGKNQNGDVMDYMLSWSVPWGSSPNLAYTEIREKDHFPPHWDYIYGLLRNKGNKNYTDTHNGGVSTVTLGGGTSPQFSAIMTLVNT